MNEQRMRMVLIVANVWLLATFLLMDVRTWWITEGLRETNIPNPKINVVQEYRNEEVNKQAAEQIRKGAFAFRKCSICHNINKTTQSFAPDLICIVGDQIANKDYFRYSAAIRNRRDEVTGGAWCPRELYEFIKEPQKYAPGTRMWFPGIREGHEDIRSIIHFLAWSCEPDGEDSVHATILVGKEFSECRSTDCSLDWILPKRSLKSCGD